jgi:3-hydroxyisobutyrate dehydrogenase
LLGAGAGPVFAYDIHAGTPGPGERIRRRAAEGGVTLVASSAALAAQSSLLISTVVADAALSAAEQTAPFLETRHLYADLNSVSPETKRAVEAVVTGRGARFVEAAVMGPVPPSGHRVPMLLAGSAAPRFAEQLAPYGMRLEVISERVGAAAAVKLCRSIVVKGMEALMLECALAAESYGAGDRVFASLEASFPGLDWKRLAGYMISRVVLHGERRAREMEEAARMLDSIGIAPLMAEAAAGRQDWCSRLGVRERFEGAPPEDYGRLVAAIKERMEEDSSSGSR